MANIRRGLWSIYQDSPEYGCDDNPSYHWFAFETRRDCHLTGRSLRAATYAELVENIDTLTPTAI